MQTLNVFQVGNGPVVLTEEPSLPADTPQNALENALQHDLNWFQSALFLPEDTLMGRKSEVPTAESLCKKIARSFSTAFVDAKLQPIRKALMLFSEEERSLAVPHLLSIMRLAYPRKAQAALLSTLQMVDHNELLPLLQLITPTMRTQCNAVHVEQLIKMLLLLPRDVRAQALPDCIKLLVGVFRAEDFSAILSSLVHLRCEERAKVLKNLSGCLQSDRQRALLRLTTAAPVQRGIHLLLNKRNENKKDNTKIFICSKINIKSNNALIKITK